MTSNRRPVVSVCLALVCVCVCVWEGAGRGDAARVLFSSHCPREVIAWTPPGNAECVETFETVS